MILKLTDKERKLLRKAKIKFDEKKDYTSDEIYELSDFVADASLEHELKDGPLANDYFELGEKLVALAEA